MLTFDAGAVVKAIGQLRTLEASVRHFQETDSSKKTDKMDEQSSATTAVCLSILRASIESLNVKVTKMAVDEMLESMGKDVPDYTYQHAADDIQDIGITLRRELNLMKTFCVEDTREAYFAIDPSTFGDCFGTRFPSMVYEIDEAGKCHALSRSTACVFHLMRAMEIGVGAIARSLNIPDPVKPAERNWGAVLKSIKTEMERRGAAGSWKSNDAILFAELYVSLDAVRVAWRNATMHVENKYVDDESEHIFVAVRGFLRKLSGRMDETGNPTA
jgi:hypothetical protein